MLIAYLADIDEEANKMFDSLEKQLAKQDGVTKQFKAEGLMQWVRKMNNIHNCAVEIVKNELIYQ